MDIRRRILQLLEKAGMTPSEAKFYLTAHQAPRLTIKELQKMSGLSCTSAYRAFENLKNMGLITSSAESWKKNVETVPLRAVAEKLAKEQRRLRKVELELQSMGDLMGLAAYSHLEDPIEIITDQNKIQEKAFEKLYKPWEHFLCYGSAERLIDVIGDREEKEWVKRRAKMGKSVSAYLTEIGEYANHFLPNNNEDLRNVKIAVDKNNQDQCVYIYDDEVIIWDKNKELGNRSVIIKDPAIVKMQHRIFRKLWESK
jgi:sugar-specific transcriptional regulator TrmB